MHRYIGYENLIGTLPDGNLGITNGGRESIDYAAKYASRLIPTSPPPTYVAPPPAPPTYLEPPPVIQVPISPPQSFFDPVASAGVDIPGIGPADTMGPLDFPEWGNQEFDDPFSDPRLIGPRGGPSRALPGSTAADSAAQTAPDESTAFSFASGKVPAKPLTKEQQQGLGIAAAIALFLVLGG